jgi:aconitate hydratase 2/2-methylisocitrate dehydratase
LRKDVAVLESYRAHVAERAALGIPPLPLTAQQTRELVELLKNPPQGEGENLVELLTYRVPAGVDDAAKVKAEFLAKVAKGEESCALVSKEKATELLGTMLGGYNVKPLIDLLATRPAPSPPKPSRRPCWSSTSSTTSRNSPTRATPTPSPSCRAGPTASGSPRVRKCRLAEADRVQGHRRNQHRRPVAGTRRLVASGHPAARAGHAQEPASGYRSRRVAGERGPIKQLEALAAKGNLIAYVGDVVGTGSSRKSATNSVLWFTGEDIPSFRTSASVVLPRFEDRSDLLQHHGRRRRAADRTRRRADGTWATRSN